MTESPWFWLSITLLCIFAEGFYSMLEMAAVSFNRVRLEYYVRKGVKRAIWLQYLLQKPSRLFGTIMLGVNIALQVGSQSSREFYIALNLDPNIAPFVQVFLVVILAELSPLFAARRFAENVVMLGIPIVYATHRLFSPLIWIIGIISRAVGRLFSSKGEEFDVFLSRDELQKVFEEHEEEGDDFNRVVANIFSLRGKTAAHIMTPLYSLDLLVASHITTERLRQKLGSTPHPFVPIFHKRPENIVAMAYARDLLRISGNKQVRDFSRSPWFITQGTKLTDILQQFRRNNQRVAVVLNASGSAVGLLTLDDLLEEIFGHGEEILQPIEGKETPLIERSFPGNTSIADFNREYGLHVDSQGVETLAQLMVMLLDHPPEAGDTLIVENLELTAEETTLLGIKTILVRTLES